MPNTPNYALPYPLPSDPADIPADLAELATATDTALKNAIAPLAAMPDWALAYFTHTAVFAGTPYEPNTWLPSDGSGATVEPAGIRVHGAGLYIIAYTVRVDVPAGANVYAAVHRNGSTIGAMNLLSGGGALTVMMAHQTQIYRLAANDLINLLFDAATATGGGVHGSESFGNALALARLG